MFLNLCVDVPGQLKTDSLGQKVVGVHTAALTLVNMGIMKSKLRLLEIMAEANKYAAGEWTRAHAPQRLLAWLKRFHAWERG